MNFCDFMRRIKSTIISLDECQGKTCWGEPTGDHSELGALTGKLERNKKLCEPLNVVMLYGVDHVVSMQHYHHCDAAHVAYAAVSYP